MTHTEDAAAPAQCPRRSMLATVAAEHHGRTILLVDDEERNLGLLRRVLEPQGHRLLTARDGHEALELVAEHDPDLVLSDVMMPGMDGVELCRRIKNHPRLWAVPVVLITAMDGVDDRIRGIEAGCDDFLGKPFAFQELRARVASLMRVKDITDALESAEDVIYSLAEAIEAKDPYTKGHGARVGRYAGLLGESLGLGEKQVLALNKGGLLHDIGKIGICDGTLLKPGRLDEAEMDEIRSHPEVGERICCRLKSAGPLLHIIRSHHERWDGAGYPDRLGEEDIPTLARIAAVADAFDAMTTSRPYRNALSVQKAVSILLDGAGTQWDADMVEAFIELVREGDVRPPDPSVAPAGRGGEVQPILAPDSAPNSG